MSRTKMLGEVPSSFVSKPMDRLKVGQAASCKNMREARQIIGDLSRIDGSPLFLMP
jgi:hypothetical protein